MHPFVDAVCNVKDEHKAQAIQELQQLMCGVKAHAPWLSHVYSMSRWHFALILLLGTYDKTLHGQYAVAAAAWFLVLQRSWHGVMRKDTTIVLWAKSEPFLDALRAVSRIICRGRTDVDHVMGDDSTHRLTWRDGVSVLVQVDSVVTRGAGLVYAVGPLDKLPGAPPCTITMVRHFVEDAAFNVVGGTRFADMELLHGLQPIVQRRAEWEQCWQSVSDLNIVGT